MDRAKTLSLMQQNSGYIYGLFIAVPFVLASSLNPRQEIK